MTTDTNPPNNPDPSVVTGLSMAGGLGLTVMVVAAGIGVIDPNIDSNTIGLFFVGGLAIFVTAIVAWFFYVQPHKKFDDINVPLEEEHDHDH